MEFSVILIFSWPGDICIPCENSEMCSRPGCRNSIDQEYFMDRLLGRCYTPNQGVIKYLVCYERWDTTPAVFLFISS